MTPVQLALTLLFLPLVSAAITAFFFRRNPLVGKILSIGTAAALVGIGSILIFATDDFTQDAEWLVIGPLTIHLGVLLDPLSKLMLFVVVFIVVVSLSSPCSSSSLPS